MKSFAEISAWCTDAGAVEEFEGREPIGQVFARFAPVFSPSETDCVRTAAPSEPGMILLSLAPRRVIPLPVEGAVKYSDDGELEQFGAEQITAGVWALAPSLFIPGAIHVFVVLYDVPVPAPWERRIVLASA